MRRELAKLVARRDDPIEKKMLFVGWLNARLPRDSKAVLVGGSLVQFYSGGAYESVDIDLVTRRRDAIRAVLLAAGMKEDVRGFEDPELGLVVDISTKGLRASEDVLEIQFEGLTVPVVTLEDAIVDRLLGAKYWRSDSDWEQALLMYRANVGRVRMALLKEKAKANDVEDLAARLVSKGPGSGRT